MNKKATKIHIINFKFGWMIVLNRIVKPKLAKINWYFWETPCPWWHLLSCGNWVYARYLLAWQILSNPVLISPLRLFSLIDCKWRASHGSGNGRQFWSFSSRIADCPISIKVRSQWGPEVWFSTQFQVGLFLSSWCIPFQRIWYVYQVWYCHCWGFSGPAQLMKQ